MNRNICRVLLVLYTLMVLFGSANGDTFSMDSALVRSEQCFAELVPVFEAVLQEFETSYLECLLYEETEIGKPYGHRDQNSEYVIAASTEDNGRLYENHAVEKCHNASKRAYVENTARNFKVLHRCLRSTDSLVSSTTEMTTVVDEVSSTGSTTTDGTDPSSLLPSTTEMATKGDEDDEPSTTTEKSVQPPTDNGATSNLKTNVSYLLLGINILKYAFYCGHK